MRYEEEKMRIGAAPYAFRNNDIDFNFSQMEKAMKLAQGKVDLLCFGESFLQGFDALDWNYERDKTVAVSADSDIMCRLCEMSIDYGADLLFGYIERKDECLYSSCAVIEHGKLVYNYRRISKGWKAFSSTDEHYQEGTETEEFLYQGKPIMLALCGDMWDYPELFKTEHLLIWPVYVDAELDEWPDLEVEYARQAQLAAHKTLMINSISTQPTCHGGTFYFVDGKLLNNPTFDKEEIFIVEV
jgi:N-carbamoylputrescine amidase